MSRTRLSAGVYGVGAYLPNDVRANDWWPEATVAAWRERDRTAEGTAKLPLGTRGEQLVAAALTESYSDPFRGAQERRVMPPEMRSSEMEIRAARDALQRAGVVAAEIDLLCVHSVVPDFLSTNQAATLHRELGLTTTCLSFMVEAACNSFQIQMAIARRMIETRASKYALLVQSCAASKILPYDQFYSAWFGDGATAVVLGPVLEPFGVMSDVHETDGTFQNALASGVPGDDWFSSGEVVLYPAEPGIGRKLFLSSADSLCRVMERALSSAGLDRSDIDFFACHQATPWFRRVLQDAFDLTEARSFDTFPLTASLFAGNIPLVWALAERDGMLCDGDVVLTAAAGNGITSSSLVLRWGRGSAQYPGR